MEKVNCNLCGENNDREIYNNGELRVVMCNNCSLVYLNPRLSEEEYREYYNKNYQNKRHQIADYEQAVWRLEKKNSYEKKGKRAEDFIKYLDNNSRVLEIGSGWGTMLKVIKDKCKSEVWGIEISELAAQVARDYYGLNVFHNTFEEYHRKSSEKKFDFILLVHVLEHFQDPGATLSQIANMLVENGYLYIAVPNLATPDELLNGFFRMEHCYYFTPLTLSNLMEKCGLKIIEIKIRPNDLRIIAAKKKNSIKEIDKAGLTKEYSREKVLKNIRKQARKEKVLRAGQDFFKNILPEKAFINFKKIAIKMLNK